MERNSVRIARENRMEAFRIGRDTALEYGIRSKDLPDFVSSYDDAARCESRGDFQDALRCRKLGAWVLGKVDFLDGLRSRLGVKR